MDSPAAPALSRSTPPWPRAALFDLDGTLVDSAPDIAAAIAELMAGEGLAAFTEAEVRAMIGHGMPVLVERAFAARGRPLADTDIGPMVARMSGIYANHLTDRTRLLPGVGAALAYLEGIACRVAVVTNKPEGPAETVLGHFGLRGRVELLIGDRGPAGGATLRRKPAPDMLNFALHALGVDAESAIMVGDSEADIVSAQAAGVFAIAIEGGYAHAPLESYAPDLVLPSLAELPRALSLDARNRS